MKILHLNSTDKVGGAALGAYSVHKGLLNLDINSKMLVQTKISNEEEIIGADNCLELIAGFLKRRLDKLPTFFYPGRQTATYYPAIMPTIIYPKIKKINPDIINLHWICGGFLDIESLAKFNKPIIWTLRDMWAFTGGCHFSENCNKYTNSCGSCPILGSSNENDLTKSVWKRKNKTYKNLNLTVVTLSSWLADCAKSSSLFKNTRIEVIPNGFDFSVFKPLDKISARNEFSLPADKNLILFGAVNSLKDPRKGFQYLIPALQKLYEENSLNNTELVVFGASEPDKSIDLKYKANYVGYIKDPNKLAKLYSAADVMIVPSTQESFGKTAAEAMACGTPVAAFDTSGLKDIISHKISGYLATPYEINDLADGIKWILEDANRYKNLSFKAENKIKRDFDIKNVVKKYENLYREILDK